MMMPRKLTVAFSIIFAPLAVAAVASSALAESFSIDGKALNTNNQFRRIDGQPRMSIYKYNADDLDQKFERLRGTRGGTLLKHRSTGKCLNAHYLRGGAEINVWNCDVNDPDQNFNLIHLGNQVHLIQRSGTNLCVDSPTRQDMGKLHLWTCNSNNPNQRWLSISQPINPPPRRIPQTPNITIRSQISNEKFEVVLAAIRPGNPYGDASGLFGHVWLTLVHRWDIDLVTYSNNIEVRRVRQSTGNVKYDTISALGKDYPVPQPNSTEEKKWSSWWIHSGASRIEKSGSEVGGSGKRGASVLLSKTRLISYRRREVSRDNYYKYLPRSEGGQGATAGDCNKYEPWPDNDPKTCNCSTFAVRIYRDITGSKDFDGISILNLSAPLWIAQRIDFLHGWQDWLR
jgi:hypothetical protein